MSNSVTSDTKSGGKKRGNEEEINFPVKRQKLISKQEQEEALCNDALLLKEQLVDLRNLLLEYGILNRPTKFQIIAIILECDTIITRNLDRGSDALEAFEIAFEPLGDKVLQTAIPGKI